MSDQPSSPSMQSPEMYPIISKWQWAERAGEDVAEKIPREIPFDIVKDHDAQCKKNHCGQDLKRLAERGGLSPAELYCIVHDKPFSDSIKATITERDACFWLLGVLNLNRQRNQPMTAQIAIESARGAIAALKSGGVSGPYLIRVPEDLKSSEEEILKELRPDGAGAIETYSGPGVQVLALNVTEQEKLPTNHA